ncbi:MAG: hypothetical protein ACI4HL_00245 [Ruminococcus sp.]
MTIYDRMMSLLSAFRVYDEGNTFLQGEIGAYEEGLNIALDLLHNIEQECFVATATDYGLYIKEHYFDFVPRDVTLEKRRSMLMSILSVDENDFTVAGMRKFLNQYPMDYTITESPHDNTITITLTSNDWISENLSLVKSGINKFFPSHIAVNVVTV